MSECGSCCDGIVMSFKLFPNLIANCFDARLILNVITHTVVVVLLFFVD